ncbi:hypothetical protein B5X24_HaOG210080 [Helicoverpa armigera]|nr:hypothetical protein B5X24_HaOG210080 [Helicoverpa armigera]
MRVWAVGAATVLLDDERPTLHELGLQHRAALLLELMSSGSSRATERRETLIAPNLPGATGLHNLGNTCFMNAALQSVWNTGPLTRYFNSGMHLYEVNTTNPLGTKGVLALRYGELCKEVWSCSARSVAPLRVRWCVSRWARALAGGGQHDAQELLAWLLDALHEDLNRAAPPPARCLPRADDSGGRPDQVVAAEAWEQHTSRNASIMTELFYGQLKSKDSVRFDAFNMLSLPLPMESYVCCELRVMLLDGSVPIKYGVRVNSEGTYLDLKKKLSELCGLAPESMLIVEVSGATIGRVLEDSAKISAASACELYAYELPQQDDDDASHWEHCQHHTNAHSSFTQGSPGVVTNTQSYMLIEQRFQRSRSEILMSQSPPSTLYKHAVFTDRADGRSNTLPKEVRHENGSSSPTLSVKSLNLKPSSPRLGKVKFGSSPSNMCKMDDSKDMPPGKIQYLVAVHRKQCRSDAYFLPWQRSRSSVFGVPLLVGVRDACSGRQLYARVWQQVARLLSARPPHHDQHNHATDCDDSLGYEFPFRIRVVRAGGAWCARCAWPLLCRGCALPCTDTATATPRTRVGAAIDSDAPNTNSPIAKNKLNRHNSARLSTDITGETECGTVSAAELSALLAGPRRGLMLAIDWDPTALHLRYQSTREKKVVNFPFQDFDPTAYLASVPQETILRHTEILSSKRRSSVFVDDTISESDSEDDEESAQPKVQRPKVERKRKGSVEVKGRQRLESTSLVTTPSHSGQLSGGHYVAYCRNPSGAWLCYNDSSCRELSSAPTPPIDPAAAYLLFYERQGLDYERYLPDITGKEPVVRDAEVLDPDENDLKKMCTIV